MAIPVTYPGVYVQEVGAPVTAPFMSDDALIAAYGCADPDSAEAAALADEIERRGLGV